MLRLAEGSGFSSDAVHQWPALHTGEDALVDRLGVLPFAEDQPTPRPTQRLVRGGGNEVAVGHRAGVQLSGHQTGDVGDVGHQVGPHLVGNLPQPGEVNQARIGAGPADDHLGTHFPRLAGDGLVVEGFRLPRHAVGVHFEQLAGEVDWAAVCQVAAVGQAHAHDAVARLQHGEVDGHVGLRAGVGLHVGVLGPEQLLGAVDGQLLHDVHVLAAAVVAVTGVALGVFVGEH